MTTEEQRRARRVRMQQISHRRHNGRGDQGVVLQTLTYEHPDGCSECGGPMSRYNSTDRCSPCYAKVYPF